MAIPTAALSSTATAPPYPPAFVAAAAKSPAAAAALARTPTDGADTADTATSTGTSTSAATAPATTSFASTALSSTCSAFALAAPVATTTTRDLHRRPFVHQSARGMFGLGELRLPPS